MVVLKVIMLDSFYFEAVVDLEGLIFQQFPLGGFGGLERTDF